MVRELREPGSAQQAVTFLLLVLLVQLLRDLLVPLPNPEQWVLLGVALIFLLRPIAILIHEFGHAAAVRWLGRRDARVQVGGAPCLHFRVGRVHVTLGVLPRSMRRIAGRCTYDAAGIDWKSRTWISLAGPLATFLQLALVVAAMPLVWNDSGWVRNLLLLSEAGLILQFVLSGLPLPSRSPGGAGVLPGNDGWKAREAFRLYRAGVPAPERPPAAATAPAPTPPLGLFNWFAEDARRVVRSAIEQARVLGHNHFGTEHLLLGLLTNPRSRSGQVLIGLGVDFELARREIRRVAGDTNSLADKVSITIGAKRTLEYSKLEALKLGSSHVRSQEILLALTTDWSGLGAQVLESLGADREAIRGAVKTGTQRVSD
jgi:ATP-dependent Clp protease ATP-binding subunit ClpC